MLNYNVVKKITIKNVQAFSGREVSSFIVNRFVRNSGSFSCPDSDVVSKMLSHINKGNMSYSENHQRFNK